MEEIEALELEKVKLLIKYFNWTGEDLDITSGGIDGYEKLNDGNIFTSIINNNRPFKGHYFGVIDGDNKIEDHNFEIRQKPRVYISSNTPIKVGDEYELFKKKK